MWHLLAILAFAGLSSAQIRPSPCDSPSQWEAHYNVYDPVEGHQFLVSGRYHYDKENLRKARFEEVEEGRNTTYRYLEVIELYKEDKRYEIDVKTRECVVRKPYHTFRPHDIPATAKWQTNFYIGSSAIGEGNIELFQWSYNYPESYWEGSFTTHGCIPYRNNYFNHTTFGASFEEFWDVTPGISDPNVFVPPPQCHD